MKRLLRFASLASVLVAVSCAGPRTHEVLNATLWAQDAAEARACTAQAYRQATARLIEGLASPQWTAADEQAEPFGDLPPAVILDVDETVLDNSFYEARIARTGGHYTREGFEAWAKEGCATAIEGAVDFCKDAAARGVTVFYVTNRSEAVRSETRSNLESLQFPLKPNVDVVICQRDDADADKQRRRREICQNYRVLLLIGDSATDFSSAFVGQEGAVRRQTSKAHDAKWGSRWIILPNAMYGDWEKVSGSRTAEAKLSALRESP